MASCEAAVSALMPHVRIWSLWVPLQRRLKTENGSSSKACAPEGNDRKVLSTDGHPGTNNDSIEREVPAEELKALRDVGFEAGGTRHVISHANLQ